MNIFAINFILSFAVALLLHELGHFLAARVCRVPVTQAGFGWGPKLFGFRCKEVDYQLRALPIGAYIRMDMSALQRRPLLQQLFVLLAGVLVNFILGGIAWGTVFGASNLLLAVGNLFPLYQQQLGSPGPDSGSVSPGVPDHQEFSQHRGIVHHLAFPRYP